MFNVFITLISILLSFVFCYLRRNLQYWRRRNIPQLEPTHLIFGNVKDIVTGKFSYLEHHLHIYNQLAPHKFAGFYELHTPLLIIRDPELIKHVFCKDFHHFMNRFPDLEQKNRPETLILMLQQNEKWKNLREKLTPLFSSGKMKMMFGLVKKCADDMHSALEEKVGREPCVDISDLIARYTMDVVTSCAFGMRTNFLRNQNSELYRASRRAVGSKFVNDLARLWPQAIKYLNVPFIRRDLPEFLHTALRGVIENRKKNNTRRNDFLNLLLSLKENERKKLSGLNTNNEKDQIIDFNYDVFFAQCFIFYAAGFESSSSLMNFTLFELARHPAIQRKVQNMIDTVFERYDGKIEYSVLQHEIPYMDQVISETLRIYPATSDLNRVCSSDYLIPDTNITIKKGTKVRIPLIGLHHDPQYFVNPYDFDPEHFSKEAIASRPHYVYSPFGEGPRNCIGMRFALLLAKLGLVTLLRHYEFKISSKTTLPIKFCKHVRFTKPDGAIYLNCHRRMT